MCRTPLAHTEATRRAGPPIGIGVAAAVPRRAGPGQRVPRPSAGDGATTGSAVLASRAGGPAAPADHTLFVVDWDAAAADELQQQLNALTGLTGPQAAGHASAPWQVLNCPSSTVQAGQGRDSLAHGLQTVRYLGTAARAAWRSRYQGQVVVWRQAIGYLLCALPRWPRWLCPSGHRPLPYPTTGH